MYLSARVLDSVHACVHVHACVRAPSARARVCMCKFVRACVYVCACMYMCVHANCGRHQLMTLYTAFISTPMSICTALFFFFFLSLSLLLDHPGKKPKSNHSVTQFSSAVQTHVRACTSVLEVQVWPRI